ncbi:putative holin [Achromobacter dolens]|uniref:putative holin n=1 Tax=Achromobacter TaxID=222 RepID=UPI003558A36F
MGEPTSTTAAVSTVFLTTGLATALPGVDGNALIGAFAGAVVMTLSSKETKITAKFCYALVSFVAGYLAAPDVVNLTPIQQTGAAAFLASASIVALVQIGIEKIRSFDVNAFFNRNRGGG